MLITLTFPFELNVSVQVGDFAYYAISSNGHSEIVCNMPQYIINAYGVPAVGSFIMFSKDNKVNLSSILGYYANVKYVNDSEEEAELFSVAADIVESSK